MKVILLQNVKKVGQKGEVKEVSEGFARNHLIPQGLAKVGTEQSLKEVAKLSKDKAKHEEVIFQKIAEDFDKLDQQTLTLDLKSNKGGALFAKFDEKNLLDFLHQKGYKNIEKKNITIPDGTIKHIGTYTIVLKEKKLTKTFSLTIV